MTASAARPFLAFACAHLTDERLFAAQIATLRAEHDCAAFAFRDHDSLGAMAEDLLARAPARFTLIGLSLGGYLALEIFRRAPARIARLALLDTTAAADSEVRRAGRLADIEKVRSRGIDALIQELPARWLHPAHRNDAALVALMADMARNIGARGQMNQQAAMLARPDAQADLERVRVPTLVACGREDPVTPVQDHEAIAVRINGARLAIVERCGHLSSIEQPDAVTRLLTRWLQDTREAV